MPIVPVVFSSYESFYSKTARRFDLGLFCFPSLLTSLLVGRRAGCAGGKVIVEVLPPLPTVGLSGPEAVAALTARTRLAMLAAFNRLRPEAAAANAAIKAQ